MISHAHRCIYVHIPKTAGTSIEFKLGHFKELKRGVQDHRTIRDIEPLSSLETTQLFLKGDWKLLYRRAKYLMNQSGSVSREQFGRYYKFTFVRNPWARVFSWYKNVMRDEIHRQSFQVSDQCSFKEFLRRFAGKQMIRPQLHWIKDVRGKIPLDFVGRYENLEVDFGRVAEAIGLKDKSLTKLLPGESTGYAASYDDETRDLVAKVYAEEILLFKYKFGE